MTADDLDLLQQYAAGKSEDAFAALVNRHLNLVYAAALRQVRSAQLAEEVAQSVFSDLARSAAKLKPDTILTAWLYEVARRTSIDLVRKESRRQLRERAALEMTATNSTASDWTQLEPLLDEAMDALEATDRAAVLLRYFDNKSLRDVGRALGTTDDTAQKRVSRAVERLRAFFASRGVSVGAGGLAAVISANAVQAAPAGLAATISSAVVLAGTTITTTVTATKAIAMTTLQKALVTAIVVASVVAPLVVQHQAKARLHDQEESARQQTAQLAKLGQENDGLSNRLAQTITSAALFQDQRNELLRLRGEVGRLRTDVRNYTKIVAFREEIDQLPLEKVWPARVNRLKQWLQEHPSEKIPELYLLPERSWINSIYPSPVENDEECRHAMSNVRANAVGRTFTPLANALHQYAEGNGGQFPTDLSQLKPFLNPPLDDEVLGRYTILPARSLVSELRPGGDWVITEKAPVDEAADPRHALGLNSSRLVDSEVTNRWTLLQ